ncbi:cysteine proteinase [Leucogyrophana mollusca]|uniref:Cysteine proteinase n=1 Tax=Leucogyrophana mollusca TaxID=85980 RepID=A0ACB8BA83_9AGAM|nr:cysteine proteinase [Leucogyrophana mollusca]
MTVAELKEKAKEDAQHAAKGVSAITLIRGARSQSQMAQQCENSGDLKGALSAFTRAGTLAQKFMDSAEFNAERQPGKHGVLHKEFMEFQKHDGSNLKQRVDNLQSKLTDLEKSAGTPVDSSTPLDPSARKMGTSIADRLKSLHDAGLSVGTTKRFSREIPSSPVLPTSPDPRGSNRFSAQISSPPPQLSGLSTPSAPSSSAPSPHAVVPPSSLGPPSPTSSDSSSPRLSHFSLSEFAQTFPSIDELDEMEGLRFPSIPQATGGSASSHWSSTSNEVRAEPLQPQSSAKPFPVLSIDPGPRPSSTPITPTANSFMSRPASPARSPVIHPKPSIPGLAPSPLSPRPTNGISALAIPEKPSIPVSNTITPKLLYEYMYKPGLKTLVVDVRTRDEFEKEHIKADAVVCLEPSVLMRANTKAEQLEDSLTVAPRDEWVLFQNRDKFDVVAIYDDASETYGSQGGALSSFVRVVYENAFRKMLKNTPMLLVGGLHAWKRDIGSEEVMKGSSPVHKLPTVAENDAGASISTLSSLPDTPRFWTPSNQPAVNGMVNGKGASPDREERPRFSEPSIEPPRLSQRLPNVDSDAPPSQVRRHPLPRPPSSSISYSHNVYDNIYNTSSAIAQPLANGASTTSIQYPSFPRTISPTASGSSSFSSSTAVFNPVSLPPQASINPSPLSRRRSEYMEQSQSPISGFAPRLPIDYPDLSPQQILRPPPPAASPASERQDSRPRMMHERSYSVSTASASTSRNKAGPKPPTIQSDYPVTYWSDMQIITAGLKNLGNTCYMNATIQCLSATVPFARFFIDGRWKNAVNMVNPLGTKGNLAQAFASILYDMSHSELPYLNPTTFRKSICGHAPQFGGSDQHDSQEFLTFLLDGLHEDMNRVLHKPNNESTPEREAELEKLPQQIASEQEWSLYRMRNDSLVVDFFQGQFRNRMECMTCHKTSTTYNSFMYLSLPIPPAKGSSKVSLQACLDAFVKEEVLEKSEAWHCPNCKALRKATKRLSLSRLPPILLIHLKRFSFKGPFSDKVETVVDFPLRSLDLTNYMPPPLPPGMHKTPVNGTSPIGEDPRVQMPPYKYDLYGVTNHFGTLGNGHYTAFIASRGGWVYCDDSRVTPTEAKEVVGRPAYVLYYKRTQS